MGYFSAKNGFVLEVTFKSWIIYKYVIWITCIWLLIDSAEFSEVNFKEISFLRIVPLFDEKGYFCIKNYLCIA